VLGEGIACARIRAVRTDMRGPAENSDLLSYDGGFLRSFREQMRGFRDLNGYVGGAPSTFCLPDVGVTAFTVDAVYFRRLQSQVVLNRRSAEEASRWLCESQAVTFCSTGEPMGTEKISRI
jgi:hypothetical protein